MKRKINKPILLNALALTQGVGTVMVMQNSIVQVYAEQKNKEVTSQEFLDYINQLKEQNPDFKFSKLVGIRKDSNNLYTLFYGKSNDINEDEVYLNETPISKEIANQMIEGYAYFISDLLTYNARSNEK